MFVRSEAASLNGASRFSHLVRSGFLHNYAYYSVEIAVRTVVQIAYFAIVARTLGVSAYGKFAAITAAASFASVLVGFGVEQLMLRRASGRASALPEAFGYTLIHVALSFAPVSLAVGYAAHLMSPDVSAATIVGLVVAEVLFARLLWLINMAYLSQERAGRQTVITTSVSLLKLGAAALMWRSESSDGLSTWAIYYVASNAVGTALAILMLILDFGRPRWILHRSELRRNLQYGFETVSMATFRELDKPIVLYALGPEIGGLYAAAYRIVDTACSPIAALLRTVYARYFVHGRDGNAAGLRLALNTVALGATLSFVIGAALYSLSWIVPLIIGAQFIGVIPLIKAMTILPALAMLSSAGGDLLRSLELLRERFCIWLVATTIFAPICYLGILADGGNGAALARCVNHLILGLLLWGVIAARKKVIFRRE